VPEAFELGDEALDLAFGVAALVVVAAGIAVRHGHTGTKEYAASAGDTRILTHFTRPRMPPRAPQPVWTNPELLRRLGL
jgi:hypothetical protein